jgi:putative transcriptional regulator
MAKRKTILNAVHETARGLRDAGLMEAKTMREFDVLCLPRVKEYTAAQIKRIRERLKVAEQLVKEVRDA